MPRLNSSKILFVLDHFYPHVGGAETLFGELSRSLVARGCEVDVVTLWETGVSKHEVVDGVRVCRVWTPRFFARFLFTIFAIPVVFRMSARANVVHTAGYAAAGAAWVASRLRRKPCVLTVFEVFADQWSQLRGVNPVVALAYRAFERFILRLPFAHYVCISEFTRRRLQSVVRTDATRTSVIYPSIDYDFWNPDRHEPIDLRSRLRLPEDAFVFLYFGRPGVSKGVEYLIEAAARVCAEKDKAYLVLLLSKRPLTQYRKIRALIEKLKLSSRVKLMDSVPRAELPGCLRDADLVVVPSVSEGFGYSAVEAATLGCPVVATTGHATEEVLGGCVRLVPPKDSAQLANAIIAATAKRVFSDSSPPRFDLETQVNKTMTIYNKFHSRRVHDELESTVREAT